MSTAAQKSATGNYCEHPARRRVKRSDVMAPETDRSLTRTLGQRLSEDAPKAAHAQVTAKALAADDSPTRGGIFAALRRSPLVGADLDLSRSRTEGRNIDL